jgi:EpsI family protein
MVISKKAYSIVVLTLALAICLRYTHMIRAASPPGLRLGEFPMTVSGYEGKDMPYPDWLPEELGARDFFIRQYESEQAGSMTLYVAYFDARYGGTAHNPDVCYPAQGWEIMNRSRAAVQTEETIIQVTRMLVQKGLSKQLVLFYFQTGDRTVPELSHYRLMAIIQGILFNKIGGAIVLISAPIDGTIEETYAEETEFLSIVGPMLGRYLPA